MNFFGVGPMELLLIAVIAVIVLGPERFPQAAVQVARALKFLRGYANSATSELREEFQELTKEYESLRAEMDEMRGSVMKDVGKVTDEMGSVITEAKPALKAAPGLDKLLDEPIVEPGGELPPDRQKPSKNGSQD
jgi:sec-independent protein translocase protein TatB